MEETVGKLRTQLVAAKSLIGSIRAVELYDVSDLYLPSKAEQLETAVQEHCERHSSIQGILADDSITSPYRVGKTFLASYQ